MGIFDGWTRPQLRLAAEKIEAILDDCDCLQYAQLRQAKRRERGAWVKPGLADSAGQLEKTLLASYDRLARDVIASLSGHPDDIATGRLAQARPSDPDEAEIDAAMDEYDLPDEEKEAAVDRSLLAAILTLLLLWRRRHLAIADDKAAELFGLGRAKALQEVGKKTLALGAISSRLKNSVLAQFEADIDRLETGLRDGTARSQGLEWIVKNALTVGAAAAYLRRLFDREQYRIGMFAEALVWRAWLDGYRAGAIEVTRAILQANGVHLTDDLEIDDLTEAEREGVPLYEWVGPDDERTCDPCSGMFGDPVLALDEADLPAPEEVCAYQRACRHWWQRVEA